MDKLNKNRTPLWCLLVATLAVALYILCATGCKTKQREREKLSQKIELQQVKTSVTTTVIDTTITISGDTASIVAPIFMLNNGLPIVAETNGTIVTISYDPVKQTIHATGITKPKTIPIKATKTQATTESNKIKATTKETKSSTTVKPDYIGNIITGLLLTAACVAFFLFVRWRLKANGIIS